MKYEILLADDDASVRLVLSKALTRAGHTVKATDNAETLLKWSGLGQGDIILTDVMMGGTEIFNYLPLISENRPGMPIIVISANNTVNTALKAGKHKVFEYIPKPFDLLEVTQAILRAGLSVNPRKRKINDELSKLPMIGRSAAMQPVYRAISRFAAGNLPVLIQGEVGTGKDLVAKLLHDGGVRRKLPFLRETDFENISLTLQKVNGGDIYIDEIAELSPKQQEKLLALLTASELNPPNSRPRLLSSTRKDLRKLASEGKFRDDLLYRINVAEIKIPPLSERDRDIYELSANFLSRASTNKSRRFDNEALDVLHRHNWSGNVRELENLVNRLSVLYSDDLITAEMVLQEFTKDIENSDKVEQDQQLKTLLETSCRRLLSIEPDKVNGSSYNIALSWVEKPLIIEALRLTGGNRAKAADYLGIHRNTLRSRLKALDIS
ncbi:sigma-54 dependent transcriptional regulator [Hellea sp.]|nr:sigma-54 dependent transcriptional regulator [Hellea sp.]